jgi:hypothetical protein
MVTKFDHNLVMAGFPSIMYWGSGTGDWGRRGRGAGGKELFNLTFDLILPNAQCPIPHD